MITFFFLCWFLYSVFSLRLQNTNMRKSSRMPFHYIPCLPTIPSFLLSCLAFPHSSCPSTHPQKHPSPTTNVQINFKFLKFENRKVKLSISNFFFLLDQISSTNILQVIQYITGIPIQYITNQPVYYRSGGRSSRFHHRLHLSFLVTENVCSIFMKKP